MLSKEEAKEKLKGLVDSFSENPKYWDSKPEEDIKHLFIEPLFEEVLGWDRKDVSKEPRVLKGRADYILKNGNQEVLVIEAKKTNVSLDEEEGRQAVSYAYHRKIKFAVLTNFKDIRVYHALSNIKRIDGNLLKKDGAYFRLNFSEFLGKFDLLWLLSKESFEKKEINKLLSTKDEKLNKPIDKNILDDLLNIRDWLSKEIKSKKNYLSQEVIDEIVQIFIDRLIFIRSVEDRGLEPMNYLKSLESDVREQRVKLQLFPYFLEKFEEFNKKYDSKLFEKGLLEKEGAFSDGVLRKVILALYFGSEGNQERYLFDLIPGDLFGSIYEQYLGTILAGTEKRVKLDSASGKRKKMGIYYTPSYIVEYIIKNTVGEYIKDKSIDEILEINIVDPACGSGSFLIRAFQEICDKVEDLLKEKKFSEKSLAFKSYKERLNLAQKTTILTNCIYGVDLDEKAVELARLNLLLKILEGEGQDTKVSKLPQLANIKCGNSLIDDSNVSDRAFNWNAQFKDVFAQGGFDVVVGNPPYVRVQELSHKDIDFFKKRYDSAYKRVDIAIIFFEKALDIIKKKGKVGFISSNQFLMSAYGENIRRLLLKNALYQIIDFGDLPIFEGALTYTSIFIYGNDSPQDFEYSKIKSINYFLNKNYSPKKIKIVSLNEKPWNLSTNLFGDIFKKINLCSKILNEFAETNYGIITGKDEIMISGKEKSSGFNPKYTRKIIFPENIFRYFINTPDNLVIYPYKSEGENTAIEDLKLLKESDSKLYSFLIKNKPELQNRKDSRDDFSKSNKWYGLVRFSRIQIFEKPKIITPGIVKHNKFCLDESKEFAFAGGKVTCITSNKLNLRLLLGVLNSKFIEFYLHNICPVKSGGYFNYSNTFLSKIPIRLPSPIQEKKIVELVNQMLELQKKYHDEKTAGNEKERLKQQIDNTDYEIDQEVYNLYGINPEEQKIIEESLK